MTARTPDTPPPGQRQYDRQDASRDVLAVHQAADRLGITHDAVRKKLQRGTLPGEKVAGEWRVFLPRQDSQDTKQEIKQHTRQDATETRQDSARTVATSDQTTVSELRTGAIMGRKTKKSEQREGTCVYCGAVGAITRDHVFPKALFVTLDPMMITVPACAACNEDKRTGDEDLRDLINMDLVGSRHPDAGEQANRIARATLGGRSRLGQAFRDEAVSSNTDLYLGLVSPVPFNSDRMIQTLRSIVRGLYYHETTRMLPVDVPVEIMYIHPTAMPTILEHLSALPATNVMSKGNRVAGWASFRSAEDPDSTLWLLEFNGAVHFAGMTGVLAESLRPSRKGNCNGRNGDA